MADKRISVKDAVKRIHLIVGGFKFSEENKYALVMAQKSLKKQIPKKPSWVDSIPHSRCPACHNAVATYIDSPKLPYCHWCGQALDWGETE